MPDLTNVTHLILNFPREIKLQTLRDALEQNNMPVYHGLVRILLNTPINEGGIETEVIQQLFEEHFANKP